MKYTVQKLDGRFSYNDRFRWLLSWPATMYQDQSILRFNQALQWCIQTWGWSVEVRQYYEIAKWTERNSLLAQTVQWNGNRADLELPPECNSSWSWGNEFDNLRIYLLDDQALSWFQLAHPVDQK